jgi:hypothetical protein
MNMCTERLVNQKPTSKLDYSTLSVAVTTLVLILLVELIRHKLEVNAVGRPFFNTVLEGVYRDVSIDHCMLVRFVSRDGCLYESVPCEHCRSPLVSLRHERIS